MNKKHISIIIIAILVIALVAFFISKPKTSTTPQTDEEAIKSLVSGFVKNKAIKTLDKESENSEVDRIEIKQITKNIDGVYDVQADIVELSTEGGSPATEASRRGIFFTIKPVNGVLEINTFTISAYAGDGEWIYSKPSAQGIDFMYPKVLPATYITTTDWPPVLEMPAGDYKCVVKDSGAEGKVEKHMVGDREYCVTIIVEGAAGSTYTTYEYVTKQGDFVPKLSFMLRTPQCMNYDEPTQSACKSEQASFSVDGLADRIVSSIRMK